MGRGPMLRQSSTGMETGVSEEADFAKVLFTVSAMTNIYLFSFVGLNAQSLYIIILDSTCLHLVLPKTLTHISITSKYIIYNNRN